DGRIKVLEERVAALENKETAAVDLAPLEARIAALESAPAAAAEPSARHEEIDALRAEIDKLKSSSRGGMKSLILISQLQDAIRAGRPFASELATLAELRPD